MTPWEVVLILLIFLVPVGIAFVAVQSNTAGKSMDRKSFVLRVLALSVAMALVSLVVPEGVVATLAYPVMAVAAIALIAYWAVDRLRDMGSMSKNRAIITAVPLIGGIYVIYLMVAKGTA